MNLYDEIKSLWTDRHVDLAASWVRDLEAGLAAVESASKTFHEWAPLRFYVTLGGVGDAGRVKRGTSARFSLRYRGQEVANVKVRDTPVVVVSPERAEKNLEYFKVTTKPGKIPWKDARKFRALFKVRRPGAYVRSKEHEIEAAILKQLEGRRGLEKFGNTLRNARHCGLTRYEYPVQFPVPISANTGKPEDSRGNIDILVRRGIGRGTRLSVWELKTPGVLGDALAQSYIYAVTLALILRSKSGSDWYRVFKFKGPVPKRLRLEAVTVVTPDQEGALREYFQRRRSEFQLDLPQERAKIDLRAILYDPTTLKMRPVDLTG